MQLQRVVLAIMPFVLVALLHHLYYTTHAVPDGVASRAKLRVARSGGRVHPAVVPGGKHAAGGATPVVEAGGAASGAGQRGAGGAASPGAAAAPATAAASAASGSALVSPSASALPERPGMHVYNRLLRSTPVGAGASGPSTFTAANGWADFDDFAARYPPPTLSATRLLDGSPNYLPVPDADSDDPTDLRWRKEIRPGAPCPKGRRPFHVLLTAQASAYQEWQSKIMHYHYRKTVAANPCTEMTGFTRILASPNGEPDGLMATIPTITIAQADRGTTRGFQVINRPWTIDAMLKDDSWRLRVPEDYVYIAETDHLILRDIPNRATPALNVAFFFPYMSPVPEQQSRVVKRFFPGDPLTVQPVGPSPALMHVNSLKRLTPLWLNLSVELKADPEADAAFGWVLEMWGYSLACANLGIQNFVWQQLQIEPSATWHQNLTVEDPYIYHYTFGVEYTADGVPVVGAVGEWSLDKRHYFGGYPPKALEPPPECARECAWVWWRAFNEATEQLGAQWDGRMMGGTTSFRRGDGAGQPELTKLGAALVGRGPWSMGDHQPIVFYKRGRVSTPFGRGSWEVGEGNTVHMSLCGSFTLIFDSEEDPTSFTYTRAGGRVGSLLLSLGGAPEPKKGALLPKYASVRQAGWAEPTHAKHPSVLRVLGTGPWAWAGIAPMAFLDRGVLVSPWGTGSYRPDLTDGEQKTLILSFVGAEHRVVLGECHTFTSTRLSDGQVVQGWVQLGERARSCPGLE